MGIEIEIGCSMFNSTFGTKEIRSGDLLYKNPLSYLLCHVSSLTYKVQTKCRGPLHKTFTGEKSLGKSENSGKHEFTIDFTIGRKLRLK